MNFPLIIRYSRMFLAAASLCLAAALSHAAEPGLITHWLFGPDLVKLNQASAAVGELHATLKGTKLVTQYGPAALQFNGRDAGGLITTELSQVTLPSGPMTVEAWVLVNKPLPWGGILSCLQDNGDYERGWVLGYINANFVFGLASQTRQRLTYLKGTNAFQPGRWYHVAGTYDGQQQMIFVNGQRENLATDQIGPIAYPPRTFYEFGAYHDDNEYYHLDGCIHEIRLYDRALSEADIARRYANSKDSFPEPPPPPVLFPIALGPFVEWIGPNTIALSWETEHPMPSIVEFARDGFPSQRLADLTPKLSHTLTIPNIARGATYSYQMKLPRPGQPDATSKNFQFDSTFYYLPAQPPQDPSPYPQDAWSKTYEETAGRILAETGVVQGYCLVLGAEEGRLAYHLALHSNLKIVGIEEDPTKVATARRALDQAGLYGVRVSIHQGALTNLPYGPYFANLIVSDRLLRTGQLPGDPAQVHQALRPAGGVVYLGQPTPPAPTTLTPGAFQTWLKRGGLGEAHLVQSNGLWAVLRRGPLAGGGSWTHQYGSPDNAACSQDALVSGDLQVLWWGEPGPRPMPDRGNRNPAPLSINGHLFVQGNRILFGMDAYNGTIRWTKSVPETRRANMLRDCSNMAATSDHLYVAQGAYCYALDADHGSRDRNFKVPPISPDEPYDWGYVACVTNLLIGSALRPGSAYLGDDGEWYEDYQPAQVAKVTSQALFAFNRLDSSLRWTYRNGVIINSTITIGDSVIYFVESRAPAALAAPSSLLLDEITQEQYLVALDLESGRLLWERKQDFSKCQFTLYLSYAQNTLIAMGSDQAKVYHLYALETQRQSTTPGDAVQPVDFAGSILWEQHFKAYRDDHSGHLQRPVIVGETVYTDKRAFALRTGALLRSDLPDRRGCGTMSASLGSLFYRHHFHGAWDLKTDRRVQFQGIRSGCWLSLISAGGLLLAPETSAGCSCTHAIQTSVAYLPTVLTRSPAPKP